MFQLPPLPFKEDALEPYMDAETLGIHYGKHHQGYVNKLNAALEGSDAADMTLDGIIKSANTLTSAIKNNGGGVWNHTFYWNCMGSDNHTPSVEMVKVIEESFGSFEEFQEQFNALGASVFGSGWVWVLKGSDDKLTLTTTANQDHPWQEDKAAKPVMVCDVWEHAYYLKYRNMRGDYLQNFWKVVDWEKVEKHYTHGYSHEAA